MMKVLLCVVFCGLAALALAEQVKYDNYKVYRFTPRNQEEHDFLLQLEENNPGVVFWKHVRGIGYNTDIMFPPHLQPLLESFQAKGVLYTEMVNDVQSLITAEAAASRHARQQNPKLSWDAYYSTEEIHKFLDESAAASAHATVGVFGQSSENRDLKYIAINKGNTKKPTVWVDANIHAREWITNTIATYLVNDLLTGDGAKYLDNFNFYITPVLNPDGYEYTRATDRMWRKTRSNLAGGLCKGADPNRNFDFSWNTGGSSSQPCSDTFMGVSKHSEPEVSATQEFIDQIAADNELVFYLSLHSYSQLILIPYGTALGRVPDHDFHMSVGRNTAAAIRQRYNTNYTPGNIVELLYVASGSSGDHVKGMYDTPLTYTFEMRDTGTYGFILPPNQILPSCLEFMDGFGVMLDAVLTKVSQK